MLIGREALVAGLFAQVGAGNTVLIHGPWGVGKSALLAELLRRWRASGRPCGLAPRTTALGDVTRALADAYPKVSAEGRTQRRLRSSLHMAVEANPGVLLLDHLASGGTALKGFLRSLRGTGLGVLMAADVEDQRDRDRVRAFGLAYREIEVPLLPERHLRELLEAHLARRSLPYELADPDRGALITMARGRPGWIRSLVERLASPRYWAGQGVLLELLRCDLSLEVMNHYLRARDREGL